MKFKIEKEVFDKYPDVFVGVIVLKGIDNRGYDAHIERLLLEVEEFIKTNYLIDKLDELSSPWEAEMRIKNIKAFKTIVQVLMEKILTVGKITRLNKLMDTINYFALKNIVPISAEDLDHVSGDIRLAIAEGRETFIPSIGEKAKTEKDEVIYRDDIQVLARKWNWKESYATQVKETTRNAIVYLDGLPPMEKKETEKLLKDMYDFLQSVFENDFLQIEKSLLSKDKPEIDMGDFHGFE